MDAGGVDDLGIRGTGDRREWRDGEGDVSVSDEGQADREGCEGCAGCWGHQELGTD